VEMAEESLAECQYKMEAVAPEDCAGACGDAASMEGVAGGESVAAAEATPAASAGPVPELEHCALSRLTQRM